MNYYNVMTFNLFNGKKKWFKIAFTSDIVQHTKVATLLTKAKPLFYKNQCMFTLGWACQNKLPFQFVSFFPVVYLPQ